MSDIIEHNKARKVQAKSEDGKFYVKTTFHDDAALRQNERIRSSGMLEKGRLGLHDNEDIRATISCPSVTQWNIFKKKFREVYKMLNSRDESERMSAVKRIQIIHPDWIVQERL